MTTEPAERGSLHIADHVVQRVAGHAVTLVPHANAAPRRVLGVSVGGDRPRAAADVEARVYGDVAAMHASVSVQWPRSVVAVADQVRTTVRREVERITGVRVDYVDIEVPSITTRGVVGGRVE